MRAEFDESLVTGNEMIDTQHKELIDKINKLLDSCETSKEKVVAVKTLDYLADYTEFHFGEEEKLQESINYPAIAEHKKEHDKLRAVVKDLYNMLEEECRELNRRFITFNEKRRPYIILKWAHINMFLFRMPRYSQNMPVR